MNRLQEIETRLNAIKTEIEAPGADIDKLNTEVNDLLQERSRLMAQAQTRQSILSNIANGLTPSTPIAAPPANTPPTVPASRAAVRDTEEYRSAFFNRLQGVPLTEAEQRAIASTDNPSVIPTHTVNEIIKKLRIMAPLLNEVQLFNVAGNITVNVEGTVADAQLHAENAEVTPDDDGIIPVYLGGYEIIKLIGISGTAEIMSISAFEDWVVSSITDKIAEKIEYYLIHGTGTNQPKGVDKANTWTDATNARAWASSALAAADIFATIAILPATYDRTAKWLMNKRTFWNSVYPIRDDSKSPIVRENGGEFYLGGFKIMFSDKSDTDDIFLGDWKRIIANMPQNITLSASTEAGFKSNTKYYRGVCMFDSDISLPEAFVKCAPAAKLA